MTREAFCTLTQDTRDQVILAVFVCIIDGLGNHGGFLRAYASVVGTVVTCQEKAE